jgi:hypothetical protein
MTNSDTLADKVQARIAAMSLNKDIKDQDALLHMGNWHDSIPRAVIIDPILQPVDKCVYLFLRTFLTSHGSQQMPSYDDIGYQLKLSRGTIARSLSILRITRWITQCNLKRDAAGRFQGNIYALHDEVIGVEVAMHLDGKYIDDLESMAAKHSHARVRDIAQSVLKNLHQSYDEPTRVYYIDHLDGQDQHYFNDVDPVQNLDPDELDSVGSSRVQNLDSDENNEKIQRDSDQVQNLDSAIYCSSSCSSSSSKNINKTTTNTDNEKMNELVWPKRMNNDHKRIAWFKLRQCPEEFQQLLLDECAARSTPTAKHPIRDPVAWLNWAVVEVLAGNMPVSSRALNLAQQREHEKQSTNTTNHRLLAQAGPAAKESHDESKTAAALKQLNKLKQTLIQDRRMRGGAK